ncbi:MAG: hypothetical protein GC191_06705 [Azospirillum sp.]|nr:hypothetical protein [Azospirillum sp.]
MSHRFLAATILLVAGLSADPGSAADVVAAVAKLRGEAFAVRAGGTVALTDDASVLAQDVVQTGSNGRVRLRFIDGSVVTVGEGASLRIADYRSGAAGGRRGLDLLGGAVRAVVETLDSGDRFEIGTATAVASVRGTDLIVIAAIAPTRARTEILAVTGQVAVRSRNSALGGGVVLRAGEGTDVAQGQLPTKSMTWGVQRVSQAVALTSLP